MVSSRRLLEHKSRSNLCYFPAEPDVAASFNHVTSAPLASMQQHLTRKDWQYQRCVPNITEEFTECETASLPLIEEIDGFSVTHFTEGTGTLLSRGSILGKPES